MNSANDFALKSGLTSLLQYTRVFSCARKQHWNSPATLCPFFVQHSIHISMNWNCCDTYENHSATLTKNMELFSSQKRLSSWTLKDGSRLVNRNLRKTAENKGVVRHHRQGRLRTFMQRSASCKCAPKIALPVVDATVQSQKRSTENNAAETVSCHKKNGKKNVLR